MFGRDWRKATGTIVGKVNSTRARAGEFAVDVRMDDGRLFRTEVHWPINATNFREPSVGDTVGVEVDAHDRVRFDKSDPALIARAPRSVVQADFRATLAESPGSPPASGATTADDLATANVEGLTAQAELREKMAATTKDIADMNEVLRAKLAARGVELPPAP
ncbi:MAG TPA: hypothetical protein VGF84_24490 [Micromonosporaceae bacterium]|jgi:hypothetical protein